VDNLNFSYPNGCGLCVLIWFLIIHIIHISGISTIDFNLLSYLRFKIYIGGLALMGRKKKYRQKIDQHVNSLKAKSLYTCLFTETHKKFVLEKRMAEIVANKAYITMINDLDYRPGNVILLKLIHGRNSHHKISFSRVDKKQVRLTPVLYEDIEIYKRSGLKALQNSRICRLIEEAYFQNALFNTHRLSCLVNMGTKALQKRLKKFWSNGIRLPISGMKKEYRNKLMEFRATAAVRRFLNGEKMITICENYYLTTRALNEYLLQFARIAKLSEKTTKISELKERLNYDSQLINEYLILLDNIDSKCPKLRALQKELVYKKPPCGYSWKGFVDDLETNHDWSLAKIRAYINFLETYQIQYEDERPKNSIIYHAVSADEPAGKPLSEAEMLSVQIEYCSQGDFKNFNGYTTSPLKWGKILHYTTQVRKQGALLNQADLVFLLGVNTSVIRRLLKENKKIFVPTRGNIADIGPGLTHAEEIIEFYLQGYTETAIKKRTGHCLESIENYIRTFANVYGLLEEGLPLGLIRKVLGKSMKLIEKYKSLYDTYKDKEESAQVFLHLQEVFKRQKFKKKINK